MTLYADRVQETTTTVGTITLVLAGAVSGYRAFSSAFSNGDTVRYAVALGAEWEVGEGVYSSGTLTRATVFASSNTNALVNFSAGSKSVWCDIPAAALANLGSAANKSALYRDASGNVGGSAVVAIDESGQVLTVTTSAQSTIEQLTNYAGASSNGANIMLRKARGTSGTPTKALSADQLGGLFARGYFEDGTPGFGPSIANAFRFVAEEDFTSTAQGTAAVIALSKIGAATAPEVFRLSGYGFITVSCQAAATGSIPVFKLTAAAHTGQTASTELSDVLFDSSASLQFATGAITTQRQFLIKARTYAFVGASTITNAATVAIDKAPVAGTNATITNAYSLWCQAGLARFDGSVSLGATPSTVGLLRAPTGATVLFGQRDTTNANDFSIIETDAAGILWIGGDAALTNAKTIPQINVSAQSGGSISAWVGALDVIRMTTLFESRNPMVGYAGANSVWGAVDGQATIAVSTANITLTSAQYSRKIQKFTGAPAATRTITYPLPADEDHSYVRHLRGEHTVSALTISVGSGTTASLAVGTMHTYLFTPDGVRLLT